MSASTALSEIGLWNGISPCPIALARACAGGPLTVRGAGVALVAAALVAAAEIAATALSISLFATALVAVAGQSEKIQITSPSEGAFLNGAARLTVAFTPASLARYGYPDGSAWS